MIGDRFEVKDKDPNYVYRWVNSRDRVMLERQEQGWEIDRREKSELPAEVLAAIGNTSENPGGSTVRQRGDLILMRMRKDVHEERVERPRREAAERQGASFDTMVQQANEETRKRLKKMGYKPDQIRDAHVFVDTAGPLQKG